MNKQGLIEHVAKETEASKAAAERAVNAILGGIQKGLKGDKRVQIVGFGTFGIRKRSARKGRNPQTGEVIKIAASKTVGFKAGAALKKSI